MQFANQPDFGNNITLKLPCIPTFEEIFRKIRPLLIFTTQALEEAVPRAKDFFEGQGKGVDKYLFNDLVRYYVKCSLENAGFSVEEEEQEETVTDYQFHGLANNGLAGAFNCFRFRILKADHGELPLPGPSETKQQYYNQQLPLLFDIPFDEYVKTVHPNLLILWEVDAHHNFAQLRLACPKSGGKTRDSVQAYFNEPIPHAAEIVKGKMATPEAEEGEEDIQITEKEPKTVPEYRHDIR